MITLIEHKFYICKVALLCLLTVSSTALASSGSTDNGAGSDGRVFPESHTAMKNWRFTVYLDDQEIGHHNFTLVHKKDIKEIYSNASFDVKFLFFNAYSYRHDNVEKWDGQCLKSINAVTDDNGELYNVSGKIANDAFVVNTAGKQRSYLPCVQTFAYWDPDFLKQTALLNSQTGEMVDVDSELIGKETLKHRGKDITARHYRLKGDDLQIDLWYSDNDHWLALESLTENGSIVRYTMP
jgi:hypothetical protein